MGGMERRSRGVMVRSMDTVGYRDLEVDLTLVSYRYK